MRRVEPDFSIGQPVTLLDPDVIRYARSVLADESFQYEVQRQVGEQVVNSLHRFDVYGNPLIDPIPIEPGFTSATAAPDGRFILAFGDQFYRYPPPVRLYDAQANPEREFFEYIINPPPIGSADFFSPLMAYQNDGAIYFGWNLSDATGFHQMLNTMHPYIPGDMNRDGLVNNFDIDSFVFALSNLPAYAAAYNIPEDAAVIIGDINEDGFLNNFDIDPFVMLLAGE